MIVSLPKPALKMNCSAAAGGRVDGLDGMVGEWIAARPNLQGFAAAASRDRLTGVVEDELVCVRTQIQIIRLEVFVTGAVEASYDV